MSRPVRPDRAPRVPVLKGSAGTPSGIGESIRGCQSGFALIIVLLSLGLLALLVAALVASARGNLKTAAGLRASAAVEAAADGAIRHAVFQVWRGTWAADGILHRVTIGSAAIEVAIEDQGGRIDPNFASPPLLAALLTFVGVDPSEAIILARRIVDWRSPMPFSLEGGLKAQHYREAGLPYGPPDRPFLSVAELGQVSGMTQTIVDRLRPYISVHHAADPSATDGAAAGPLTESLIGIKPSDVMSVGIGTTDRVLRIRAAARLNGEARFVRIALVRVAAASRERWQILGWE